MTSYLGLHRIALFLLMTFYVTEATIAPSKYKKLQQEENITGTIVAELTTRSKLQCSDRCSSEAECGGYQLTRSGPGSCILIHRNSTAENKQAFLPSGHNNIYKKECTLNCKNGGKCTEDIDSYKCSYPKEFYGENCELKDECYSNPCINGNCTDSMHKYSCQCQSGYSGINCENDIDECESTPCVHGSCSNNINNYNCQCDPGYLGINCETDVNECESMPCVHGSCSNNINNYNCQCDPGCLGINCETDVNECESMPCVHGSCSNNINNYNCQCDPGYFGINCETDVNECESMPCVHGSCFNNFNNYNCQCDPGYLGINCETERDECDSNPCVNGDCTDHFNSYTCQCHAGYTGAICQTDVNECESNPCVRGSCSNMVNKYSCACPPRYAGQNCETYPWLPPAGWTGPDPVVYRSLDTLDYITIMEGTEQTNDGLIDGKVNKAIRMDITKRQWVDLGILQDACILRPETCGAAGAAVALWIKKTPSNGTFEGIISSAINGSLKTFFQIFYNDGNLWIQLGITLGIIYVSEPITANWTHLALNYIVSDSVKVNKMYFNGVDTMAGFWLYGPSHEAAGHGVTVLVRYFTDVDDHYANVEIDELLIFNQTLNSNQINQIMRM